MEGAGPDGMHAFSCYAREDALAVDRLRAALEAAGIRVWRDTAQLWPGEDWREKIRLAITGNALAFVACFSRNGLARDRSYQNEELILAVDELRQRRPDASWLIPVRLGDCVIPDLPVGGGRTLAQLQRADLFGERQEQETARLVTAITRIIRPTTKPRPTQAAPGPTRTTAGQTHLNLDLLFAPAGPDFEVRVAHSPAGTARRRCSRSPLTELELENFALKIDRPRIRTRRQETAPVAAAKELGGRLFEAVFAGPVKECLRHSTDEAAAARVPLRIRLFLSDCPELVDLPWELLYDAADDWFLVLSGTTPVVRCMRLPVQPRPVPVTLPLRIWPSDPNRMDCRDLTWTPSGSKSARRLLN